MDELVDAWDRYAEACFEHDPREAALALSHLIPAQRQATQGPPHATVSPRAARSAEPPGGD